MLTSKKHCIRIFALVLALMMTVAVFAGCNNKAIDDAKADADAANKAAQDAQASADSIAQSAKDLADQLKAAQDKIKQQEEEIKKQEESLKDAQSNLDSAIQNQDHWHGTEAPETSKPIIDGEFNDITEDIVTGGKLKAFSETKNLYLAVRADWYTMENYLVLSTIFDNASVELMRETTTADKVDQIIANAATKAAAVPSIVTEAAEVQKLIDGFGNVVTDIVTASQSKVDAAREAFDKWVENYEVRFFVKNGYTFTYAPDGKIVISSSERRNVVDFAKKLTNNLVYININDNTNSLNYAEAKLKALNAYAEDAIKAEMLVQLIVGGKSETDAQKIVNELYKDGATQVEMNKAIADYKVVKNIVDRYGVTYTQCKANAQRIEDAYTLYRIFWNVNNGDDTPIKGVDKETLLTGEQFVKLYVLTLYNGELDEYEHAVSDFLYNQVVPYYMTTGFKAYKDPIMGYDKDGNYGVTGADTQVSFKVDKVNGEIVASYGAETVKVPADGVRIEKEFNRVAATYATKIFAFDYDKDFKGSKSLDDAFIEIDQILVNTITELGQVYCDNVVIPAMTKIINDSEDAVNAAYDPSVRGGDAYYLAADKALYANIAKLYTAARAAIATCKVPEYAEINKLNEQKLFDVTRDANGCFESIALYTGKNAAFNTIMGEFDKTMKALACQVCALEYVGDVAIEVHNLKIEYAQKLDAIPGVVVLKDGKIDSYKVNSVLKDKGYYDSVKTLLGSKYNELSLYNSLDTVRKAGKEAIMALNFVDFETGKILVNAETYQAKDAKGKDLYYTSAGAISTDSKGNKALNIMVDREIVFANKVIDTFGANANAMLKVFCDSCRSTLQGNVTDAIKLYEDRYSFGDKDPVGVYLEKDMRQYIDYLKGLSGLEAVKFDSADYSLKGDKVTAADITALVGAGYVQHTVDSKAKTYLFHVDTVAQTTDEITGIGTTYANGWFDTKTVDELNDFFALTSSVAYNGLEDCRKLAYTKDNILNGTFKTTVNGTAYDTLPITLASFTGSNKNVPIRAGYEYDKSTLRTEVYLDNLNKTYKAIADKIAVITLFSKGVNRNLAVAETQIEDILKQAVNETVVYDVADDFSLAIAYTRFYKVDAYDWALYYKNISK